MLGGWSASRVLGNFSEETYPIGRFTLPRNCPWEVDVASIFVGDTKVLSDFTACIDPTEPSLGLPSYTHHSSSQNMTITLTNGLVASIPSSRVSTRDLKKDEGGPVLGVPFLSQVYLFADYQTRKLAIGLANHTDAYIKTDDLRCVEHESQLGDLGWAVGSESDVATTSTTASPSSTPSPTGKAGKNAAGKAGVDLGMLLVIVGGMVGWML